MSVWGCIDRRKTILCTILNVANCIQYFIPNWQSFTADDYKNSCVLMVPYIMTTAKTDVRLECIDRRKSILCTILNGANYIQYFVPDWQSFAAADFKKLCGLLHHDHHKNWCTSGVCRQTKTYSMHNTECCQLHLVFHIPNWQSFAAVDFKKLCGLLHHDHHKN